MNKITSFIIGIVMASSIGCNSKPHLERESALIYLVNDSGLRTSDKFHDIKKIDTRPNYFATLGSLTYLLDENGKTTSSGFHTIISTFDGYHAVCGACEYELSSIGEVINASSSNCLELLTKNRSELR